MKYADYFCDEHAEPKKLVLSPGIDVRWETLFDDIHFCGQRGKSGQSAESINKMFSCGKRATQVAVCIGTPPFMYVNPTNDFGWVDPTKTQD